MSSDRIYQIIICNNCNGTGKTLDDYECDVCNGKGELKIFSCFGVATDEELKTWEQLELA